MANISFQKCRGIAKIASMKTLFALICFIALPLFGEGQIAQTKGLALWYETFGEKEDPPLLLIMGGCCQGILWPDSLCQRLATEGFYVIRYDHRDTGFSSSIDFEKHPYNLKDMAQDAIDLMDFLKIERAHLVGLSMGGPIAEILAVDHEERVMSMTLLSTSCDFRPFDLALQGKPSEEGLLPGPKQTYLEAMEVYLNSLPDTFEEHLELRLSTWGLLNGDQFPLDETEQREIHGEFLKRQQSPQGLENHILNNYRSEELIRAVPHHVQVPTLIFHGTEDPLFPLEHGQALAEMIKEARLVIVEGMGHVLNPAFYDIYIEGIKENTQRYNSEKLSGTE